MLNISPHIVDLVSDLVKKRWPEKKVTCHENENAWHRNRFISISVSPDIDMGVVHYEYTNGYMELHLEGDSRNPFNKQLYQFLRNQIGTRPGVYFWHRWFGMKQGRLRYEFQIDDVFELYDGLVEMINLVDPLVADFMYTESESDSAESEIIDDFSESEESIRGNENESRRDTVSDDNTNVTLETMTLAEVFSLNLKIPAYQRIYCWPQKNVELLLDDIFVQRGHKYHLGTIILQNKEGKYDIIDGQQRTVTLALILRALGKSDIKLLNETFDSLEAQKYIGYNRYIIRLYLDRFFPDKSNRMEVAKQILANISFDVLVLQDSSLDLAYTFFSTQNARGKALTDYELLKSHHLRYIPERYEQQQRHLAKMWDELLVKSERDNGDRSVSIVVGIYLYCLRKWTNHQAWYIKEPNRVKLEFEAAPIIDEIPPFGEKFDFMDPIQGGTHFFAFVNKFIQHYHLFTDTVQYHTLWETISCSGVQYSIIDDSDEKRPSENKKRTHWWYGDVIASFLFAYYLKFGNIYLSEALTCITRIVSQLRYEKSKANKQSIMDMACELGIIGMINQATSPTFFLANARNIIRRLPFFDHSLDGIRVKYFEQEMSLYKENEKYYLIDSFKTLHNK